MSGTRPQLKRSLGRVEVFALSFGTMVGWGSIVLPVQWIESGGVLGSVLSLVIATVMCCFVGLTYAELTSAFPLAGAELAFTYRSMGMVGSWFTGWMICFAYICVAAWEGIALSTALNYLFPLPKWGYLWNVAGFDIYFSWVAVGILGAVILTILNVIGVRQVAVFQILLLLVTIFTGVVYFLGAAAFGEVNDTQPVLADINGINAVLIMAPSMFIGFDMVAKSAEEMNMPLRNVPKVLIFSICVAGSWYIAITVSTYFLMPCAPDNLEVKTIGDIAAAAFRSSTIGKMIIIGGVCGIITSWNGFIVGASRIIFAMSRAKLLPAVFGIVHPKHKTPVFSIIFVGAICCLSPFLGANAFGWFVNIGALGTVISYLMVSISFLVIRKKEPDLRREYRIRHGEFIGVIAIICVVFFLFWYTPLNPFMLDWFYEWILFSVWMGIGIIFFFAINYFKYTRKVTPAQREVLIFSDEYARETEK